MERREIIEKVEEKIIFIGDPENYKNNLNFRKIILAGLKRYYPDDFSIYENGDNLLVVEKLNNEKNKN